MLQINPSIMMLRQQKEYEIKKTKNEETHLNKEWNNKQRFYNGTPQ